MARWVGVGTQQPRAGVEPATSWSQSPASYHSATAYHWKCSSPLEQCALPRRLWLICCNHVLNFIGDFRGPFRGPLYPLKPGVSRGPLGLSGGQAPSDPLVIRPLLPAPEPLNRFSTNCTVDYVGDPTPQAKIWISRPKGGVSAHAWTCHRQASIF